MSISSISSNNSIYQSGSQQVLSRIHKNMKTHHNRFESNSSGGSATQTSATSDTDDNNTRYSGLSGASGSIVDIMA